MSRLQSRARPSASSLKAFSILFLLFLPAGEALGGTPLAPAYAWAEKAGWICINQPAPLAPDTAVAEATYLRGFLWGRTTGWIHLGDGPANGTSYSNSTAADQGVNVGAGGRLSGFAWSEKLGAIDFSLAPGAFLAPGGRLTGMAWSRVAGWVTFGAEGIHVDLFVDSNGNAARDPGEENATTSPGGEVPFIAVFTNSSEEAVTVNATLDGLPQGWAMPLDRFVLLAGETLRTTILVSVPDRDAGLAGSYAVRLRAATERGFASASGRLAVLDKPIITDLTPPNGIITAKREVLISWRTSAPTTGLVHVLNPGTGKSQVFDKPGDISRQHGVLVTGRDLVDGAHRAWWVESTGQWGGRAIAPSDPGNPGVEQPRELIVGTSVAFTEESYAFDVHREYNQVFPVTVQNFAAEPRDVGLRIENPYPDVAIGFVGPGSADQPAILQPGQTLDVDLGIHLQDADLARTAPYELTAEADSSQGGSASGSAHVTVTLTRPAVNFIATWDGQLAPGTLAATVKVTNLEDPLTDLGARPADDLAGLVQLLPTLGNVRLAKDDPPLEFQVIPIAVPEAGLTGTIHVSAAGVTRDVQLAFRRPVNEPPFSLPLTDASYCTSALDQGCTSRRRIAVSLQLPAGISQGAVTKATLSLSILPQNANSGSPHDLAILMNGRTIGSLTRTLPNGVYRFDVPPDALHVSRREPALNTVDLKVTGLTGGNYHIASQTTLCLCISRFECAVFAPSQEEALRRCLTVPGLLPSTANLTVDINDPLSPVEHQPTEIRIDAKVAGVAVEGLTLRARFSNGDPAVALLLKRVANDVYYQGTWLPGCEGPVRLEVHGAGCSDGALLTRDLNVAPGLERVLDVPFYATGGTAWDWAAGMSSVLQYHSLSLKPWAVAGGLGAAPSQGLDLRETGDDLREPSLKGLLEFLRGERGIQLGVTTYL